MENTVIGKDGYPMVVSTGGYDRGFNTNGLEELITNNNIADTRGDILSAIATGTAAVIAADQAGHLVNQKATGDASVAGINATNLNGVSNIEATNRNGLAGITSTERNSGEIRMNVAREAGESRLASAINSSEIRELISERATTNLVAIKDNGFLIREEGCKTRERVLEESYRTRERSDDHFAKLLLEAEKTKAAILLELCKCCDEQSKEAAATRALILSEGQKRLETENQRLQFELLLKNNRGRGYSGGGSSSGTHGEGGH